MKYHSLPTLEEAGMTHFKDLIFDVIKVDVTNAILALINQVIFYYYYYFYPNHYYYYELF